MSAEAELILVRHGETVGDSAVRLYGSTDVELSDLGRRQMDRVRDALDGIEIEHLFVSPLQRSRDSAAIVCDGRSLGETVTEAFREIDFGKWEGLTVEEVGAADPGGLAAWKSGDPEWAFPGGDTRSAFAGRVRSEALLRFGSSRGRTLAVLHKGVVKTIVGALLGHRHEAYSRLPCELGCVYRLERRGVCWRVTSECEVGHLGADRLPASR